MKAAIVGVGFMGWIHYLAYQQSASAQLVAFCSRDAKKRSGDWRGIKGNFGPPATQVDVTDLRTYATLEEVLADDEVQLVDICLPPHMHGDAIRASLAAGKTVLCEKPLALSGSQASELMAASQPGQLLVAHILPFMPEFRFLADAVADRRFGRPLGGNFLRLIGPPDWIPDFYEPRRIGGPLIDLHVHDAHLICMLFGMPRQVFTRGRMRGDTPQYFESVFATDDPDVVLSARCGVTDQAGRPFTHGYEMHFERATVRYEFAAYSDGTTAQIPLVVLHADGSIEHPPLGEGDPIAGFVAELEAAAAVVDRQQPPHPALDVRTATDALLLCDAQLKSLVERTLVQL